MHHADLEFDVTSGVRFHPIEILLSMGIKLGVVAALGIPAIAVVIFEIMLNATSMFNHGNVELPEWLDRLLRWFVVTPEMHRIHHEYQRHQNNYGDITWWDMLFGTYHNPREFSSRCGFDAPKEEQLIPMLAFRDVHK